MDNDIATIRICFQGDDGSVEDGSQDYGVEDFAGQVAVIGDTILAPGVAQGLNRRRPENRTIWTVIGRVFNPHDNANYICLVVSCRAGTMDDTAYL